MWRVGLLGAGYIASYHAKALKALPDVKICGICDVNMAHASELAQKIGSRPPIYSSLDVMLKTEKFDVIHVLLPPDLHDSSAKKIIEAGVNVFLEKPMALNAEKCRDLIQLAFAKDRSIGINHNFLFYHVYEQFFQALKEKLLGPLEYLKIIWHRPLDQLRTGPYDIWMLRDPRNIFLEIGSHVISCCLDIFDAPLEKIHSEADGRIQLSNDVSTFKRWNVHGNSGDTRVELLLSLTEGINEFSIEAIGRAGSAKVDFDMNTFVLKRHTPNMRPFDIYLMAQSEAAQMIKQARATLFRYIAAKLKWAEEGDPYAESINLSIRSFYKGFPGRVDRRQQGFFAENVVALCEKIADEAVKEKRPSIRSKTQDISANADNRADILLIGGSGFIRQALLEKLVQRGKSVRMLMRHPDKLNKNLLNQKISIVEGSLLDRTVLNEALKGVKTVFHLARSQVKTWQEYQDQQILATKLLAQSCLDAGVTRLIYTSTIDVYYAGGSQTIITEDTPLDPQIGRRNYYAQAKAFEEALLLKMGRDGKLPVVIVRPGIVLGNGASPYHWGVGMWWHYGTICQLWGEGNNFLPFVLVNDVAEGLIAAMEVSGIEGETFNLIDEPCLRGRDYVVELEKAIGMHIDMMPTSISKFYFTDCFKWFVKCLVRHPERKLPSYHDWKSRTQLSVFNCSKARRILNWKPTENREKMIEEGIRRPGKEWVK